MNIEDLKAAAAKAGMAKFYLKDGAAPRDDVFVVGADFLERLHAELSVAPGAPAVTVDTPEFRELLGDVYKRPKFDFLSLNDASKTIIAHIDAHTAEAVARAEQSANLLALQAYDKACDEYRLIISDLREKLAATQAQAPVAARELHTQIMNVPFRKTMSHFATVSDWKLYSEGRRDARHAAAELVAAYEYAPQQPAAPSSGVERDAERYRWLRERKTAAEFWPIPDLYTNDWMATPLEIDSGIDAAITATKEPK